MEATRSEEISRAETVGSWKLWFALLGAPLAWITQLVVGYSIEEWFACAPSTTETGQILGLGVRPAALLVVAVTIVVAIASGLVAWSCLRNAPDGDDQEARRIRWMALGGIMNSILYGLFIAVAIVPPLVLETCRVSP